jgi:hypothetical protein
MEKEIFLNYVAETIKANPSWFGEMINATQYAVLQRLKEEQHKRADAESIVMVLYEKVYNDDNSFTEQMKDKAKEVLKNSGMFKGTKYVNKL